MRLAVLQPAASADAQQHYQDTMATPVVLDQHADLLGDHLAALAALFPARAASLWGITPGKADANVRAYGRMSAGDYVFFSGQGRLFAGGTVAHTFRNAPLARRLWGTDAKNQTWELMFAVDELRTFNMPYAEMNAVVGYDAANVIQGFTVLDEDKSAALFDHLTLDSDVHPAAPQDAAGFADLLAKLGGSTERDVAGVQRLEQGYLRRKLLPGLSGTCALCGETMAMQFLVAAHIKKRAACTASERVDVPYIAMPACKFGCDAVYEAGLVGVAPDGVIQLSPSATFDGLAQDYLAKLAGRVCTAFSPSRADYFAWHYENTFRR